MINSLEFSNVYICRKHEHGADEPCSRSSKNVIACVLSDNDIAATPCFDSRRGQHRRHSRCCDTFESGFQVRLERIFTVFAFVIGRRLTPRMLDDAGQSKLTRERSLQQPKWNQRMNRRRPRALQCELLHQKVGRSGVEKQSSSD